jgi:large subunit ribosomal protein L4
MLSIPVFKMNGERSGELQVDPRAFGGRVRSRLIKQAVVAHLDHQRIDSARTKSRADVEGSTRKLFRQKGTGNARMGNVRTCIRRGGGRAFAKRVPGRTVELPKKMRRLATNSAILAKITAGDAMIVDDFACSQVKTRVIAQMVSALGAEAGCTLAVDAYDRNVYLSGRNIAGVNVRPVSELNAYEVLLGKRLVFTKPAFERLVSGENAPAKA